MYANNLEVEVVDFLMKDPSKGNMPELSQLTISLPSASQYPSSAQSFTCIQNLELQSDEVMPETRQQGSILSPNIQSLSPEIAADAYSDMYGTTMQGLNLPLFDAVDDEDQNENLKQGAVPDMVDNVICATSDNIVDTRKEFKQSVIEPPITKGVFAAGGDMMLNSICTDSNAVDRPIVLKQSDTNSVDKSRALKQMENSIVNRQEKLNQSNNSIVETSSELKQNVCEPLKVKKRRSRSSK